MIKLVLFINGLEERLTLLVQNLRKKPLQLSSAYSALVTIGQKNATFHEIIAYIFQLSLLLVKEDKRNYNSQYSYSVSLTVCIFLLHVFRVDLRVLVS